MFDEAKKKIIVGKLAEYYCEIPRLIKEVEQRLEEAEARTTFIKSIRFDSIKSNSKSNDEKIAELIVLKDELTRQRKSLVNQRTLIEKQFHFDYLSKTEKEIMDAVYSTRTYKQAGDKTGYSKTQVYRCINSIYEKMSTYI